MSLSLEQLTGYEKSRIEELLRVADQRAERQDQQPSLGLVWTAHALLAKTQEREVHRTEDNELARGMASLIFALIIDLLATNPLTQLPNSEKRAEIARLLTLGDEHDLFPDIDESRVLKLMLGS